MRGPKGRGASPAAVAPATDALSSPAATGFHHEALFYKGRDGLLARAAPFVEAGIEAGENVLVALPESTRDQLEGEFDGGEAKARVSFAEMEELGRNPARIMCL